MMAFPIPSHLPRKKDPQDVSTHVLSKIAETSGKSLSAQLASSWVAELDDTIAQTKERIHKRISDDFPSFDRQLASAKSIQERLQALNGNVDRLSSALSDPESGLAVTLTATLIRQATLAQDSLNASLKHDVLSYLFHCDNNFRDLVSLVHEGKLPDAIHACEVLERLLADSPPPLSQSVVLADLKRNLNAMKARTEEQLNDACSRSIVVSSHELVIRPAIQVRQSETILPLPAVLSSLTTTSLSSQLTSLRRDIIAHYIEYIAKQPTKITITSEKDIFGTPEHKLTVFPLPPNSPALAPRLENLATVLTFLDQHLFQHLPSSERTTFPYLFCKPLRAAVLNHLLVPSLPSSLDTLPSYLDVVQKAVKFEAEYLATMHGDDSADQEIESWADNVGLHYERKRRVNILELARILTLHAEDESRIFHVDLDMVMEHEDKIAVPTELRHEPIEEEAEAAWGFEDEQAENKDNTAGTDEDGWGFDDEVEPEPEAGFEAPPTEHEGPTEVDAVDPAEAWGWNDDDDSLTANDDEPMAKDDPWDVGWDDAPHQAGPQSNMSSSIPKPAKRLEKFTSKSKGNHTNLDSPPVRSPLPVAAPPPTPVIPVGSKQVGPTTSLATKESYMVSGRTRELIQLVEDVLQEGTDLAAYGVLTTSASSSLSLGNLISYAASSVLELFRALYPVAFALELGASPKRMMRFSNDCLYLCGEVDRILVQQSQVTASSKEKLQECKDCLKLLGDSWFDETIEQQNHVISQLLDRAQGFVDTTDQDRFDECEGAVNEVLRRIRYLAQQWKPVLNKSRYYIATGSMVDAALSRILRDILALPDITEVESHRLNELCHILNALEGLFVETSFQPTFVVSYVPSWLKFSYLSELLEASIADISYLFEEGALVDFEIEELVKLVRALFADTPLRTNTISKLLQGQPMPR
ncbi:hypothetical protein AcV7_003180 [Taiwanofungus camphoratus]|nr:hypothetical protein AcV7_003180 [Antrodia cinnamomea]